MDVVLQRTLCDTRSSREGLDGASVHSLLISLHRKGVLTMLLADDQG